MTLVRGADPPAASIFPREDSSVPAHPDPGRGVSRNPRSRGRSSTSGMPGRSETSGERAQELDEIIGYHLEQASATARSSGRRARRTRPCRCAGDRLGSGASCDGGPVDVFAAVNLISRGRFFRPRSATPKSPTSSARVDADGRLRQARSTRCSARPWRSRRPQATSSSSCDADPACSSALARVPGTPANDPVRRPRAIPLLRSSGRFGAAKAWWLKSEIELRAGAGKHGPRSSARSSTPSLGDRREQATLVGPPRASPLLRPTSSKRPSHGARSSSSASGDRSLEAAIGHARRPRVMPGELDQARRCRRLRRRCMRSSGSSSPSREVADPTSIEMLAGERAAERVVGATQLEPMGERSQRHFSPHSWGGADNAEERDDDDRRCRDRRQTMANDGTFRRILSRATPGRCWPSEERSTGLRSSATRLVAGRQTELP